MAPLVLEGNNLGEKHRHYNNLVQDAIKQNPDSVEDLNFDESDIENLMKIDVASNKRDVQYILNVLKCQDMLYVSRAIKQSLWLITEKQYANIINPEYLHSELFPQMTSKAVNKLLLYIRLYLKEEDRVELFFNFYKEKDLKTALKWLPYCSLALVEKVVKEHQSDIDTNLLKRLCERSISVLEAYVYKNDGYLYNALSETTFLISIDPEKYLDILDSLQYDTSIKFGPKHTNAIMKVCPDRIINKFEKYCDRVDVKTFAKYLKKDEIKDFILKFHENRNIRHWFVEENLKHLIKELPEEQRFEFLKQAFIDKTYKPETPKMHCERAYLSSSIKVGYCNSSSNSNIYKWYQYAPFNTAFADLMKLIRSESSPDERNAMFNVLLTCSLKNKNNLQTLLQFYKERHINEAFKFKIQFVNNVISSTKTHMYDQTTWNILNELFHSMEVYIKSENNVNSCINCIITYNLLHDIPIPNIIEQKFTFNTMKKGIKKINDDEKLKVFEYLYDLTWKKITSQEIGNKAEFEECVQNLMNMLKLLIDWDKNIASYPDVLNKIRELIKLNDDKDWNVDLSYIYETKKSWRRYLFEESLNLKPSEEACINALKHDHVLLRCKKIEILRHNDLVSLKRLLSKMRIYYAHTLAKDWLASYKKKLETADGHRALVLGLCSLMPHKDLVTLFESYVPEDPKIVWGETDEIQLSMRKNIAKNMHTARPQPTLSTVLCYAKGDYLQYALPSIHSILYNISPESYREYFPQLLDTPVSLQKHNIRVIIKKLNSEELIQILSEIWKKNKNSSIRAVVFCQTLKFIYKEKGDLVEKIWNLLSLFMDELTSEENKDIYTSLCNVKEIPDAIQARFCLKSYNILKSLPAKTNVDGTIETLLNNCKDIVEKLDPDFVTTVAQEFIHKEFVNGRICYREKRMKMELITWFLLCAKDLKFQERVCNDMINPMFELVFNNLNKYSKEDEEKKIYVLLNLNDFLECINESIQYIVLEKGMVIPTYLFSQILSKVEKLDVERNYAMIRTWRLAVVFVEVLDKNHVLITEIRNKETSSRDNKWNTLYMAIAQDIADACVDALKSDIETLFPTISSPFATAMDSLFVKLHFEQLIQLEIFKHFLKHVDFIPIYLCTISNLPHYQNKESRKIYQELLKSIFNHPSKEVRMHYYTRFTNCADPE